MVISHNYSVVQEAGLLEQVLSTRGASTMAVSLQDAAIIVVVALAYGMLLAASGIVLRWIVPPRRPATLPTSPLGLGNAPDSASGQLLCALLRVIAMANPCVWHRGPRVRSPC